MDSLLKKVKDLQKTEIKDIVEGRIKDFEKARFSGLNVLYSEMCFCLLTANFNAKRAIIIQDEIGDGFINLPQNKLAKRLKELGHRYPNARAKYIVDARVYYDVLPQVLDDLDGLMLRQWFVDNVCGLGMKESSHYLRNIGFKDYAIVDFHIVDLLKSRGLCVRPKTMTKHFYLEVEDTLKDIAKKLNMDLSRLDLYLWYIETGQILK